MTVIPNYEGADDWVIDLLTPLSAEAEQAVGQLADDLARRAAKTLDTLPPWNFVYTCLMCHKRPCICRFSWLPIYREPVNAQDEVK